MLCEKVIQRNDVVTPRRLRGDLIAVRCGARRLEDGEAVNVAGPGSHRSFPTVQATRLFWHRQARSALGSARRSNLIMKIGAALAADLRILTAALDEPGADVLYSLLQLGVDARVAVPSYLGLSVIVDGSDPPFTFATPDDGAADDVCTSLGLTLFGAGRAPPSVVLILYAGTSGAFVDLAADLAWSTSCPLSDFVLDRHLDVPAGSVGGASLRAESVINQTIGVLIGRGYTPAQAHQELDTQADGAGTDRHTAAQFILDNLMADAKRGVCPEFG